MPYAVDSTDQLGLVHGDATPGPHELEVPPVPQIQEGPREFKVSWRQRLERWMSELVLGKPELRKK